MKDGGEYLGLGSSQVTFTLTLARREPPYGGEGPLPTNYRTVIITGAPPTNYRTVIIKVKTQLLP